jgi:hypothetical protein
MRATMDMTRDVAIKVRDIVDVGLVAGVGRPEPGHLCVEAAVCLALGLPHGDDPACVEPSLRRLKIALNDKAWSSPQARAQGLRRLAIAQLGSAGVLDETAFRARVTEMTIRRVVPLALRVAAKVNPRHADRLEAAAVRCEQDGTREAAQAARAYAYADADAYAAAGDDAYAAAAYADAAAYAAAGDDAYAAAGDDAYAAAAVDAYAAAGDDAAYARTRDRVLAQFAEWVVEILIDLQAPGCQWLDLVPLAEERA